MHESTQALQDRISKLERGMRRMRVLAGAAVLGAGALVAGGWALQPAAGEKHSQPVVAVQDEVRTKKLVVVDDEGVVRISIGQDAPGGQRRSRNAGITIHDKTGAERGGFGTMDDGSAVMAMDAPHGVGAPMPDRVGMIVWPNGAADVVLFDNRGNTAACLHSDGERGGLQVLKWDAEGKRGQVKTVMFESEDTGDYAGFNPMQK